MKIALAQIEVAAGQPALNTEKILKFTEQAKNQNCKAVVFPAKAISGIYFKESPAILREIDECFKEIKAANPNIIISFSNGSLTAFEDNLEIIVRNDVDSFAFDVISEREKFYSALAARNNSPLIFVNAVGIQNTGKTVWTYDGSSAVYNSRGEMVKRLPAYVETLEVIDTAEIEKLPALPVQNEKPVAQIYRALNFGVDRFLKQINMKKVVIGISGGIDSAVAAALYTKILGAENVYLVNMPSVFNSLTTRNLSEQLAKNLGCKYAVITIQNSVDSTIRQLELTPITFLTDDSAEDIKISSFVRENLQARDRSGRILATLAASIGGGFTCNANKAETTIGYATLYGDCAGVLAATADLWKFQVYELAHYLNDEIYGREVVPQGIIDIVPSAELSDAQNVDEGKGDPLHYDYHDFLFRAFVENELTPEDILNSYVEKNLEETIGCRAGLVQKYFPTAKDFTADLEKWWKQFQGIAVAKRIQAPPLIAVSNCPFGSFEESQNVPYFTKKYFELKKTLA